MDVTAKLYLPSALSPSGNLTVSCTRTPPTFLNKASGLNEQNMHSFGVEVEQLTSQQPGNAARAKRPGEVKCSHRGLALPGSADPSAPAELLQAARLGAAVRPAGRDVAVAAGLSPPRLGTLLSPCGLGRALWHLNQLKSQASRFFASSGRRQRLCAPGC